MRARRASDSGCLPRKRLICGATRSLRLLAVFAFGGLLLKAHSQQTVSVLQRPSAIAYDAAGDLFIADAARNQVLESSVGGTLSVVAGTGVQGFAGDGGPALSAELNAPRGVAVGSDGTLYIADTDNDRVRAISNGVISTVAGSGQRGFSGDGAAGASAKLNRPTGLAIDSTGSLLICDTGNHRIRKLSAGVITTIIGSGVQGFGGDGGPASAAQLDSPEAVAVAADGSIVVADSHNHRVRQILGSENVQTIAGNGVPGFNGDGVTSTAAGLAAPRGVAAAPGGGLLIADADNHRVRAVDASGTISTVAGNGVQGAMSQAAAATSTPLNTPVGVAVSPFGWPTFVDALGQNVSLISSSGALYAPAGLAFGRSSIVALSVPSSSVYGQTSATVKVTGSVEVPQGTASVVEGSSVLGTATTSAGSAAVGLSAVSAGSHTVAALYAGDGLNPAAASTPATITVQPAPVVATASDVSLQYGQAIPALTGTATGILPQDLARVTSGYTTAATASSPVGDYAIQASLSGPAAGNYALAMSPASGALHIGAASTTVAVQPLTGPAYAGTPLMLSANVSSGTGAPPVGSVAFVEGGSVVAQATVRGGLASGYFLAPTSGTHVITASFSPGPNFAYSSSAPLSIAVSAMPDFAVQASGAVSVTVPAGAAATYTIATIASPGPFTGDIVLAVQGLPKGATASFSPTQLVPGAGSATSTLTIQTPAAAAKSAPGGNGPAVWVAFLVVVPVLLTRRRRPARLACLAVAGGGAILIMGSGCASRTVEVASANPTAYSLTVTGTSTNLAGSPVVHSVSMTLNLQ